MSNYANGITSARALPIVCYTCEECGQGVEGAESMAAWCKPFCPRCALLMGRKPGSAGPPLPKRPLSNHDKRLFGVLPKEQQYTDRDRQRWTKRNADRSSVNIRMK